jgi:uncharacterized phage protein gp47/JayE
MAFAVENEGILTQTLGEKTAEVSTAFLAAFPPVAGEQLDLTPDSYTGREVTILSEQFVQAQDLLLDLVAILSPSQAQGVFVDYHLSLQATSRKPATPSTIAAIVYGKPGTAVGDKRVRYLPTDTLWRTPAGLVIGANGQTITALSAVVTGPTQALETGTEQWLIVDVTDDWDAVESTAEAILGTTAESDSAARVRLSHSTATLPGCTRPGILRALWAVPGVTSVQVWNNRTLLPNAVGVPAKSIESVVEGGSDDDVGLAILRSYNGSAGFAGTTSHTVTDTITLDDGSTADVTETVAWSRIERIDILVEVTLTILDVDLLSPDSRELVYGAVADWVNALDAGIDVYPEAVEAQVWDALPDGSVSDVVALISVKPGAVAGSPISLSIRQRARTNPEPQQAQIIGTTLSPFNLTAGWTLALTFDALGPQLYTVNVSDFAVISAATAIELAAAINSQINGGVAGVDEGALTLTSDTAGNASKVRILVTDTTPDILTALGLTTGDTLGSSGDVSAVFV